MSKNRFLAAFAILIPYFGSIAYFGSANLASAQVTDPDLVPPEVVMPAPGAVTQSSAATSAGSPMAPSAASAGIQAHTPAGWPFDGLPPPGGVVPQGRDFSSFYNQIPQQGNNPNAAGAAAAGAAAAGAAAAGAAAAAAGAGTANTVGTAGAPGAAESMTDEPNADAAGPFSSASKGCPLCKKRAAEAAAAAAKAAATKANGGVPVDAPLPDPLAILQTTKGTITIRLFRQYAPKTVANFIDLAQKGFYNGLTWHRVVPGFVVQSGCPKGDGTGGYIDPQTGKERTLPLELHQMLHHNAPGVVAMARFGSDPNSASSQFYITLAPLPKLDNKYTVFGGVVSGMDSVKNITPQDKILGVNLQGI